MNCTPALLIGCTTLLWACGQGQAPAVNTGDDQRLSALEARVAALTGKSGSDQAPGLDHDVTPSMAQDAPAFAAQRSSAPAGTRSHTLNSSQFNVPMAQLDLPGHWSVEGMRTGNWSASGPGLSVKNSPTSTFLYSNGQLGQFYQANNMQMRAPLAPEQVVRQDLAPRLRQLGYELVGQGPALAVEQADLQGINGMHVPGGGQRSCKVNVSEWRRGDHRMAVVLHWFSIATPDLMNWGYYTTELEAPQSIYDQERNGLLSGLASVRYNPAYFAAQSGNARQQEQQGLAAHQQRQQNNQASWDAHNARMRSNQANFDARQAAHRDMTNGVNNAIMGTWNNTSATMDRMQETTINGIRGEQNAWDPHTGQQGKVEAGYNNYWMNSDGQYIGTNDVHYDPNANGQWVDQWQQMPTEP